MRSFIAPLFLGGSIMTFTIINPIAIYKNKNKKKKRKKRDK